MSQKKEIIEVRCSKFNDRLHKQCNKLLFKVVDGKIQCKCSCGEIVEIDPSLLLK